MAISQKEADEVLFWFKFPNPVTPAESTWDLFPEVQIAVDAARSSAESAMAMAYTMNSLRKIAQGKAVRGKLTPEAQDCLRSALLFAGAGLDTALKRLAAEALPILVAFDETVARRLSEFAEAQIKDPTGGTSPKELVSLLMNTGATPRDIMLSRWIRDLESSSAQSADRVQEIASALGVTDTEIRKRVKPTPTKTSKLEVAFVARNQIAHELDVTKPQEAARQRLESIRRYRNIDDILDSCEELIQVVQLIVNDVTKRVVAHHAGD